jgi:hypothetical protein
MEGSPFHRAVVALLRWLRARRVRRSRTRLVLMDGGRAELPLSLDASRRLTRRLARGAGTMVLSRPAWPASDPLSTG